MHHGRRESSPKSALRPSRRTDGFLPGGMLTEKGTGARRANREQGAEDRGRDVSLAKLEEDIKRLNEELKWERNVQERIKIDLQKRNVEAENGKDLIINRAQREAASATRALEIPNSQHHSRGVTGVIILVILQSTSPLTNRNYIVRDVEQKGII